MVNGHQAAASNQQVAAFNNSNTSRRQDAFHEPNMMTMTSVSASEQRQQQQQQQQQHIADLQQQRSLAPGSEQISGGGGGGVVLGGFGAGNNRTEGNQQKRFRPQKFCSVCGDKAIACNFNAVTCESCKAFFRRNAYKEQRLKCLFESRCLITKDTRRFCSKCRLLKCFAIGMKREWILTDEQKHSKRIKIIQNKETKQRQLASITAAQHAAPKQATSSSSSSSVGNISVGTLGQRYNGGRTAPRISSSCSPANQQHCGDLRSEASSPTTTNTATTTTTPTTAKNSLSSSREASVSRSDSRTDQQANLVNNMSPPSQQQMARALIEMKDASTSTSGSLSSSSSTSGGNHEDKLQVLFPICSWSTQCHFCAMKLANNNLAPTMMASGGATAAGGNIGGAGGFDLINETTSITKDFRNNRPVNYSADELGGNAIGAGVGGVGGGSQVQLTSSRLFYSTNPSGAAGSDNGGDGAASGLVELDETNNSPTKLQASMMASTYVGSSSSSATDNNHLLQLANSGNAAGSAVSRPVTNYCFNANSNANSAADHHQQQQQHDDQRQQQQHHGSAPMNSMATDDQQQQQQQHHHHHQLQQLHQQHHHHHHQQHYNITSAVTYPTSTTEDTTGGGGNLLCFPLSSGLNSNGHGHHQQATSHHHTDYQNHLPLVGSHHQTLPASFVQARRPGLEHFSFPPFAAGQTAIASGVPNYGHPAMTAVKAYDLQLVTQQQHPQQQQQQQQQPDRIISESKNNLCLLNQTNDTHTTSSPSSNLTRCSPIDGTTTGTGTGGAGGELTNNKR